MPFSSLSRDEKCTHRTEQSPSASTTKVCLSEYDTSYTSPDSVTSCRSSSSSNTHLR